MADPVPYASNPPMTAEAWGQSEAGSGGGLQQSIMMLVQTLMKLLPAMGGANDLRAQAARMSASANIGNMFISPDTPLLGGVTANLMGRAQMQMGIASAFRSVHGAGGGFFGGGGVGPGAAGVLGMEMEQFVGRGAGQPTFTDMTNIAVMGGQGGFFNGLTDIRQARSRLKELTKTVVEMQRELNLSIQETMQNLQAVRSMGYTDISAGGNASQAVRRILGVSASTGISSQHVASTMLEAGGAWRQVAQGAGLGMTMQGATGMVATGLNAVGGAYQGGLLSDDMLFNSVGVGGLEGVQVLNTRMQEVGMRNLRGGPMNFMMAAAMDPRTMRMNQSVVNQIMSGSLNANQIQQMAQENVGALGHDGLAKWLGMSGQMRGQFQEMSGGMGGMALMMTMLRDRFGVNVHDADDPANVARVQRALRLKDPEEARAFMTVVGNWDVTQERSREAGATAERQQEDARRRNEAIARANLTDFVRRSTEGFTERVRAPAQRAIENLSSSVLGLIGASDEAIVSTAELVAGGGSSAFLGAGVGSGSLGFSSVEDIEKRRGKASGEATLAFMQASDRSQEAWQAYQATLNQINDMADAGYVGSVQESSGYWGGTRVGGRDEALSMAGMTADEANRRGEKYKAVQGDLHTMMGQVAKLAATNPGALTSSSAFQKITGGKGVGALKDQTIVDLLVKNKGAYGKKDLAELVDLMHPGLSSKEKEAVVDQYKNALNVAAEVGVGGDTSMGTMELAMGLGTGMSAGDMTSAAAQRAALSSFGAAGLDASVSEKLRGALQASPTVAGKIRAHLMSGGGKGAQTVGDIIAGVQGLSDEDRRIFETFAKEKVSDIGKFTEGVTSSAQASVARLRENLLQEGWMSEKAAKNYTDLLASNPSTAGSEAIGKLLSAHTAVSGGNVQQGVALAGEGIVGLAELSDREFNRLRGKLGDVTSSEVDRLRGIFKGGITSEEVGKLGITEDLLRSAGLSSEDLSSDRIKNASVQEKLRGLAGRLAAPAGGVATQGTETGAGSPLSPLAEAVAQGFKSAYPSGLSIDSSTPIRVIMDNAPSGEPVDNFQSRNPSSWPGG